MIPLRRALIVKEHGVLAYPEGQACAEVLIAGEEGGTKRPPFLPALGLQPSISSLPMASSGFPARSIRKSQGIKEQALALISCQP